MLCKYLWKGFPFSDVLHAEDAYELDEEQTQEGEGEGDREAEEDGTEQAEVDRPMGMRRATALAKLPSVSEWLRCGDATIFLSCSNNLVSHILRLFMSQLVSYAVSISERGISPFTVTQSRHGKRFSLQSLSPKQSASSHTSAACKTSF